MYLFDLHWQPRRAVASSMNWRQGFLCRHTTSMEQAANRAEAAAVISGQPLLFIVN